MMSIRCDITGQALWELSDLVIVVSQVSSGGGKSLAFFRMHWKSPAA